MGDALQDFFDRLFATSEPLGAVVEQSSDFIAVYDRELRLRFLNRAQPGFDRNEVVASRPSFREFTAPEYHDMIKDKCERCLATGVPDRYEIEGAGADGGTAWYETRISPLRDGDEIVGLVLGSSDISVRKRTERDLAAQTELFRRSLDIIDAIVVGLDSQGDVSLINQAGAELLGIPAEDIIGRGWFHEFLPAGERDRTYQEFLDLMTGAVEGVEFFENEIMTSEGATRLVSWHNTLMRDTAGVVTGTLSYGQDITDLSQTQDALADQQALLESVFMAAPTGIGVTRDRILLQVNDTLCEMLGRPASELVGQSARVLYESDEEFERVGKVKYEQIARAGVGSVETRMVRGDGSLVDVFLSSAPLEQSEVESPRVAFTALDITDFKQVERALAREKGFTEALLDAAEDTFFVLRIEDGTPVKWNDVFRRVSGYSDAEIASMTAPRDFYPPEAEELLERVLSDVAESGVGEVELDLLTKSGETIPYEYTASALLGADGEPEYIVSLGRDISERRREQHRLLARRDALERIVSERTASLETANRQLISANEAKDDFLAAMSHELRTPLNSIIGFTGIVLDGMAGDVTDEQHKQLDMVRKSADHLLELVNDILDLSKIEAGEREITPERVPMAQIVDSSISLVRLGAEKKGLPLEVTVDDPGFVLETDPRALQQILVNVLSNAIKFTDEGSVSLHVSYRDDHAVFAVTDTGCGIPQDRFEHIFSAFQQVGKPVDSEERGTGLGLAIATRLATRLGGSITVTSTVGEGSSFTVSIPTVFAG